ncbi:MAG: TetR/AcrR family transcriptional regulator [Polyangiaceae bacterium]|nr:TetR/AcrR family transcriptional regulator [Polyangiaceae bacterium]
MVRAPRQKRSQETADAIVEAAARVFAEMGLERATTNRIAEVAGVSVGSLYQYYSDKHALLTAIFVRESARLEAALLRIFSEIGLDDVPAILRAYTEETLAVFEGNAPLYHVLLEQVPRYAGLDPTHEIDKKAARSLLLLLELARSRIAPKNLEVAALLMVRSFRYNTLVTLKEPLQGAAREAFIEEMTAMLANYLFGPRPPLRARED